MSGPDPTALRRVALAVSVLDDVDLRPHATGILLDGTPPVRVTWPELRRALAGADPDGDLGRARVRSWLMLRRWLADRPLAAVADAVRPYAVYVEDPDHPGLDWVRTRVLGDSVDVGAGLAGADAVDPDRVVPLPQRLADAAGLTAALDDAWPRAGAYLERMGALAAERLTREAGHVLRPMGDCDVLALLASRTLRAALVDRYDGMRAVAVPTRDRGWLDLRAVDPAFALVAAHLADPRRRGLPRPALVTREEVAVAREGGNPVEIVLRDPAPASPRHLQAVPYRA